MALEGEELCVDHMVKQKGSEDISAAGLAGKLCLGATFLSLESVPGLGASSLGWGATGLRRSCLVRA